MTRRITIIRRKIQRGYTLRLLETGGKLVLTFIRENFILSFMPSINDTITVLSAGLCQSGPDLTSTYISLALQQSYRSVKSLAILSNRTRAADSDSET